ncbi:MAG TPA: hypothetical protein VMA36_19240, partial [Candidatus Limnocylindria bacterium]|nr:hypothetical protein [Candidatus Limnocylindria bacterium]
MQQLSVETEHVGEHASADRDRVADDRVEDRLDVGGRARDDLEDLRRGGLLFERFLRLVEQARVVDRDHRLVGEGLHERDLGDGERLDLAPQQSDHADRHPFADHRHVEHGAKAVARLQLADVRILARDQRDDVFDVHDAAFEERPAGDRGATHRQLVDLLARTAGRVARHRPQLVARTRQPDAAELGLAQEPGPLGHRVEDGLHVGRRRADHLEHVGRRGLPLERLLCLVEQSRVLDRDHRLVGERLRERDLLGVELAGRLAQDRDRAQRLALAQQRNEEARAIAERDREVVHAREPLRALDRVGDHDHPAFEDARAGAAAAVERPRLEKADALRLRRLGRERDILDHVAARHRQVHGFAAEEPLAALHDRLEDRLRVGDRAADD